MGTTLYAAPFKLSASNKDGTFISLYDRANNEKLFMSNYYLTFIKNGEVKFKRYLNSGDYSNTDALLFKNGIYLSVESNFAATGYSNAIYHLGRDGKMLWMLPRDSSNIQFSNIGEASGSVFASELIDGAYLSTRYFSFDQISGKIHEDSFDPVAYIRGLFLRRFLETSDFSNELYPEESAGELFTHTGYEVVDINNRTIVKTFSTPPRTGCGVYTPSPEIFIQKQDLRNNYNKSIVKGDYIYAYRADACGKFTYIFHWTAIKNPGGRFISGW
ncbi:hypothetical protein MF271_12845 [Deinococcus sp. KNUC1210]|uniref:hypothetical protein n=1 Tax=Deinococcus sp. KNUC1210 TaxID=2917691 RepID=UPI001EF0B7CD|nr:hypothetical protein [Deinococcus sp. KNUC1210]ULH14859.1 hypothetical protein MF271_12845 [Deinococcus sp. KNUC1210]